MLLSIFEMIGRFHPVVVHLPIGVLLLALLLQWLSFKPEYGIPFPVTRIIWWTGIAGAFISCLTGYLLSLKGGYEKDLINVHMWLGIAVATTSLFLASRIFTRQFDWSYKIGMFLLPALIIFTGHYGGSLTHGSDYLTEGWDQPKEAVAEPATRTIINVQEANAYADVIEPILNAKCYSCHGTKKQKGKLRLDRPEYLTKGGKNGPIFKPGDPHHSELIKRLLLPKEEEDHMPPKEKPQLKEIQLHLIYWWVEQGCSFSKKVKELDQPDKIKTLLASLEKKPGLEEKVVKLLPETAVDPADKKTIDLLSAKGVIVMPVAQGSNYLSMNFVNASSFNDADMKLISALQKQLVSIKAGHTMISDEGLKRLSACRNIAILDLNQTRITDKGLEHLKTLSNLQSLNLVNTRVSASGVAQLQNLKKLRYIYLYRSMVRSNEYSGLKQLFKSTAIDTGGYTVPTLASDTIYVTKPKARTTL